MIINYILIILSIVILLWVFLLFIGTLYLLYLVGKILWQKHVHHVIIQKQISELINHVSDVD
jgi:hypothetical protein